MTTGVNTLSEREKQALRLVIAGHEAKSIARVLDLSVHTVNERLRDARRKLGASSSREAARMLAAADAPGVAGQGGAATAAEAPAVEAKSLGDKPLGVGAAAAMADRPATGRHNGMTPSPIWFGGGMMAMSLVITGVALSALFHGHGADAAPGVPAREAAGAYGAAAPAPWEAVGDAAAGRPIDPRPALDWLALVDAGDYAASWTAAGARFHAGVDAGQWAAKVGPLRQSLGRVESRVVQSNTRTRTLPGAPDGDYDVIQFRTAFAGKRDAVETVVLIHEPGGWRVNGYFIR